MNANLYMPTSVTRSGEILPFGGIFKALGDFLAKKKNWVNSKVIMSTYEGSVSKNKLPRAQQTPCYLVITGLGSILGDFFLNSGKFLSK